MERNPLFDALAAASNDDRLRSHFGNAPQDKDAQILRLTEIGVAYVEADHGPRFKVGDIVTPRRDSSISGAGNPHVVVAVRKCDHDFTNHADQSERGSNMYGSRQDTRVIGFAKHGLGAVLAHWVESAEMELFEQNT